METPTAPELGGPDRHHVYIDSHEHDIERYDELRDILEEDGMTIYKNDEGLSESMEDGVDGSRKIVILVTYSALFVNHGLLGRPDVIKRKKAHRGPRSVIMVLYAGICPSNLPNHLQDEDFQIFNNCAHNTHMGHLLDAIREESLPPLSDIPFALKGMGFTLAAAFFYDYLKNVLPELPDKVVDHQAPMQVSSLDSRRFSAIPYVTGRRSSANNLFASFPKRDSLTNQEEDDDVFTSRRMHVILPESYLCQTLPDSCKPHAYVVCSPDEDETQSKQYQAIVYDVTDSRDEKQYRAVISFAPGLKTIADMCQDPLFNMSREDYHREMHQFYFYLKNLLNTGKYRKMRKTCNMIYIEDRILARPLDHVLVDDIKAEMAEMQETP